jgi:uncharacterized protein YbjT (DUF2867 family)
MKILLTGANGYIGRRLLPVLLDMGHEVICCVRDKNRTGFAKNRQGTEIFEVDFLNEIDPQSAPVDFDVAFFLIHSMASSTEKFEELEIRTAMNFVSFVGRSKARQIIFLSGLINEEVKLSRHLQSRLNVEDILRNGNIPVTILRAGIIVGSGSASFEIIRDLVEKLPVMVTPRWLETKCQPIAVRDVIKYLTGVMLNESCYNRIFDIGGPEVLTYQEMLLQYAEVRNLRRWIFILPVMTPRLSSYWLYFITATSYKLAVNLVNSMKIDVVCRDQELEELLRVNPMSYRKSIELAFQKIEQNLVLSSWKDALVSSAGFDKIAAHIEVPKYGCLTDTQQVQIFGNPERVIQKVWAVGGETGWYYGNWLWEIRGLMDKMLGGVGLRRGRTNPHEIYPGDALDFWRVLVADKKSGRLLLYAEMKLPGEAWLEFSILKQDGKFFLKQEATFRPSGLTGRLYWYSLLPAHYLIFRNMASKIARN